MSHVLISYNEIYSLIRNRNDVEQFNIKNMVRDLNINKKDELKRELKSQFPTVTDADLDQMNGSFENLVNSISVKTQQDRKEVEKIVADRVEFINSKHLI